MKISYKSLTFNGNSAAVFRCIILFCLAAAAYPVHSDIHGQNVSLNSEEAIHKNKKHALSSDSGGTTHKTETVVLIHGFCRTHRDMRPLKKFLESRGYHVISPDFPTFLGTLDDCSEQLAKELLKIDRPCDSIHFVGHSLGGLILRHYLSENRVHRLGRCILIATPNNGSELAGIVDRFLKPLVWIFRPYKVLKPGGVDLSPPLNRPFPEMAAIAGNRNSLLFGKLIKRTNDGRVPVDSVPFEGMKEFIIMPYHHEEIHHRKDVAELVHRFLQNGTFVVKSEE